MSLSFPVVRGDLRCGQRLARPYAHRPEALEDLTQTATVGLIKAIDRFDPAYRAASLNVPIGEDGSVGFGDLLGAEDDAYERTEWHLSPGLRWHV